jgi:hypothetical protein
MTKEEFYDKWGPGSAASQRYDTINTYNEFMLDLGKVIEEGHHETKA